MDTQALRAAYEDLAKEIEAGGFGAPPDGQWTAPQVIAHVLTNDAKLGETTRAVLAGSPEPYYNHDVVDSARLDAFLAEAPSDLAGLAQRVRESGDALCDLASTLDADQAATLVHMTVEDGDSVALDQPLPWGKALEIQGRAHLPNHTEQLRALRG
jgi:hypothetical protein